MKIGYCSSAEKIKQRVYAIQCGNPNRLELIATAENGSQSLEKDLHQTLRKFRSGGGKEWFYYVPDVINEIREIPDLVATDTPHGRELNLRSHADMSKKENRELFKLVTGREPKDSESLISIPKPKTDD